MKKLLTTLPSTKPDHFFKSQMSQEGYLTQRKVSYQTQLQQLTRSMKQICKNRLFFLFRDMQSIYKQNEQLLKDLLRISNGKQLWDQCSKQQELDQQAQIEFLIRILQALNERKMSEGDMGNVQKADHYRHLVEFFIKEIVQYEKEFLKEVEKEHIREWEEIKQERLNNCLRYQHQTISQFDRTESTRQTGLINRFRREHLEREKNFKQRTERQSYKLNPSLQLKETKQKALYKKLGVYRPNKTNPYEDKGLRKDLQQAVYSEEERKMKVIEHMKQTEKARLQKQQQKLNDNKQITAQITRGKLITIMSLERDVLSHYQNRLRDKMRHSLNMNKNKKVNGLKSTLQAYVKHEDEAKVSEILDTYEKKIRHNGNIAEAVAPQAIVNQLQVQTGRYSTLDGSTHNIQKQLGRQKRYFDRKIKDLFCQEQDNTNNNQPSSPNYFGRKSLVDLYDKSLNLV